MTNTALDSHVVETARAFAWSTLLSLTQQMLDAAHAGEWGRVRRLEADRRQRIEHFFSVAVGPDETELVMIVTPYLVKPVSPHALARPDDGMAQADDAEAYFLNRLTKVYGSGEHVSHGSADAQVGFAFD